MEILLKKGEVISIRRERGRCRISCSSGAIWLTGGSDGRDYILRRGESRELDTSGMIVLEAWEPATIAVKSGAREHSGSDLPRLALCSPE